MKRSVRVGRRTVSVEKTLVDRVVEYFDPVAGVRRSQARLATAMVDSYQGASKSRRATKEWRVSGGDANADSLPELEDLRERSRDLIRNEPLATGILATKVRYVIGGGLRMHPRIDRQVLGISDEAAEVYEEQLQREWEAWAETPECDLARSLNFYEMQALSWRSTLENGDVFALLPMLERPGSPYALKVQLVEADRCSNPDGRRDDNQFAGGVEHDTVTGAPVAYHFQRTHPGALSGVKREWDRVAAYGEASGRRQVLHLYRKLRIGQSRGVPDLAPVIELFKQLSRYTEAEIMAAVVNAMLTVFIETGPGTTGLGPMSPTSETGAASGDDDVKLAPGAIVELKHGEKISAVNPARPNSQFDPFMLAIIRRVSVALEIPYEIAILHFTSSYSASRAASNEAWRFVITARPWVIRNLCQPVYEAFVNEAVMRGRVGLPGFLRADPVVRRAWLGAQWLGPGRIQIDEKKEVEAAQLRIDSNLSTLADETAAMNGGDWEVNIAQRAREKSRIELYGLQPAPKAAPAAAPNPPVDPTDEDEEDEE
jgi:lambda family phage portal protein